MCDVDVDSLVECYVEMAFVRCSVFCVLCYVLEVEMVGVMLQNAILFCGDVVGIGFMQSC